MKTDHVVRSIAPIQIWPQPSAVKQSHDHTTCETGERQGEGGRWEMA